MPLVEHLYELRSRLTKSLLAVTVGIAVAFVFREQVFDVLKQPYCQTDLAQRRSDCTLISLAPLEQFSVSLRVSFIAGIVFSSPVWLYQIGAFITPGLHKHERRYAAGFLAVALAMFLLGSAFAYLTMSKALDFLLGFAGDDVEALVGLDSYLSFVTLLLLCFGIAFEFPVVLLFLNLMGVVSAARMRAWRRGMVVAIAAASAVITPTTDPYTFAFMAVPLYLMYEIVILLARLRERGISKASEADPVFGVADEVASPPPVAGAPPATPSAQSANSSGANKNSPM